MTLERARKLAEGLDSKTERALSELRLDPPRKVLSQIRAYLLRRSEEMRAANNPHQLLRLHAENGFVQIDLGPTIDKGSTPQHFHFDSGARLSFGLTLREHDRGSQVVAFRYHYHFPEGQAPPYLCFDLNDAPHADPLAEPRCHLHPGINGIRLPFSLHNPLEILDRIFFVLEKTA